MEFTSKIIEGAQSSTLEGTISTESAIDFSEGIDINEAVSVDYDVNNDLTNQTTPEGVENIKENYENVDRVLDSIKQDIMQSSTEIDLQRQMKRIERYKGTIFENMCKESLQDRFNYIEEVQRTIETVEGDTKPDIILNDAKESFSIGNVEVNESEDLYVEVKCGTAEYIESQMSNIEKQVLGHSEGKSLVMVTKDYLDIDPQKRANFEMKLEQQGSEVFVADVYSYQVENAVIQNISK